MSARATSAARPRPAPPRRPRDRTGVGGAGGGCVVAVAPSVVGRPPCCVAGRCNGQGPKLGVSYSHRSSQPFLRVFYCYIPLLAPRDGGFSRETRLFVMGWGGVGGFAHLPLHPSVERRRGTRGGLQVAYLVAKNCQTQTCPAG